jgi:hypothetical protein
LALLAVGALAMLAIWRPGQQIDRAGSLTVAESSQALS